MSEEIPTIKRSRKKAGQLEVFKVFTELFKELKVYQEDLDEDDFARYVSDDKTVAYKNDDVNDDTIAERVGVSPFSVKRIRTENFGSLPGGFGGAGGAARGSWRLEVAKIKARLEVIEEKLGIIHEDDEEENEDES